MATSRTRYRLLTAARADWLRPRIRRPRAA
jgi:hypothetical protein